eukprot:GEMP01023826.1.p1 GENE.GEMP01023826.1~~GEMP01023826.1.p1  ORF type:complete len:361 (+),score=89.36 GEMP01023826.1:101-1183(+)
MDVSVRWMDGSLSIVPACSTVRDIKLHLASAASTFIPLIVLFTDCTALDVGTKTEVDPDVNVLTRVSAHADTRHPQDPRIMLTDGSLLVATDVGPKVDTKDLYSTRKKLKTRRPKDPFPESPNLKVLHDDDAEPPPYVRVVVNDVGNHRHIARVEWKQYIQAHQNDRDGLERVRTRMCDYDWDKHASGEMEWTDVLHTFDDGMVQKTDTDDDEPSAVVPRNGARRAVQRFRTLLDEQLWCSASQGWPTQFDFDFLDCLLSMGASVDATDEDKWTPLMAASSAGNVPMAIHLLRAKANVNAVDCDGMSPLEFAYDQGRDEVVRLLVNKNADVRLLRPRANNWKKLQIRIQLIVEGVHDEHE